MCYRAVFSVGTFASSLSSLLASSASPKPLCPLEVTNVTTAVDIYSFGMCALEVRRGGRAAG